MDGWNLGIPCKISQTSTIRYQSSIKDRLFTEEVLYTTLCGVESLLNNRSLTSISDDVNDYECLTPNHFLIGEVSPNFSPGIFTDKEINLRHKWRSVQAATQTFWKRWLNEYLPSLTVRKKWNYHYRNIETNDLVLLKEDNVPRSHYPLARVINTYPGKDRVVRTVKVKTPSNTLVRPVGKICLMEEYSPEKSTS